MAANGAATAALEQEETTEQRIERLEKTFSTLRLEICALKQKGGYIPNNEDPDKILEVVGNGAGDEKWWMKPEKDPKENQMLTLLRPFNWQDPLMVKKATDQRNWLVRQLQGYPLNKKDRLQVIGQALNIDWRFLAAFMDSALQKDPGYVFTLMTRNLQSARLQLLGDAIPDTFGQIRKLEEEKKKLLGDNKSLQAELAKVISTFSDQCGHCGTTAKVLSKCSNCRVVQYCSTVCQKTDWQNKHKKVCKFLMQQSDQDNKAAVSYLTAKNYARQLDDMKATTVSNEEFEKLQTAYGFLEEQLDYQVKVNMRTDEKVVYWADVFPKLEAMVQELEIVSASKDAKIASLEETLAEDAPAGNLGGCKVCMINAANVCIVPCGHVGLCSGCYFQVESKDKICPFCRGEIQSFVTPILT